MRYYAVNILPINIIFRWLIFQMCIIASFAEFYVLLEARSFFHLWHNNEALMGFIGCFQRDRFLPNNCFYF